MTLAEVEDKAGALRDGAAQGVQELFDNSRIQARFLKQPDEAGFDPRRDVLYFIDESEDDDEV